MKKKRTYQMSLLATILKDRGFTYIDEDTDDLLATGPLYALRASAPRGAMEIGFLRSFDRWANSTDLTFNNPKWWDENALNKLLDQADERAKNVS